VLRLVGRERVYESIYKCSVHREPRWSQSPVLNRCEILTQLISFES
jgi:hypothetical protein